MALGVGSTACRGRRPRKADRLGKEAALGDVVLFLGAGASAGAGMPSWSDLLKQLAWRADMEEGERVPASRSWTSWIAPRCFGAGYVARSTG